MTWWLRLLCCSSFEIMGVIIYYNKEFCLYIYSIQISAFFFILSILTSNLSSPRMSHIKWDEETIAEHDKLRGTRQKVPSQLIMCIRINLDGDFISLFSLYNCFFPSFVCTNIDWWTRHALWACRQGRWRRRRWHRRNWKSQHSTLA
mgnify:CR=1 FL=1